MDTMQQEALRRAQEMHSRVIPAPPHGNSRNNSSAESKPASKNSDSEKRDLPKPPASSGIQESMSMENLFEDKEKLLILLLIMILSAEENTDPVLILALLYIII